MSSLEKYQNAEIARIVGELMSDGHLQMDRRFLISFYSEHMYIMDSFRKRMNSFFKLDHLFYKDKRSDRYKIFFNSENVALLLNKLGVPKGNKTNNPFLVPSWIYNGNPEIKSAFLSAIYDCEGYIYYTKLKNGKARWRIGLEFYKNKLYLKTGIKFMNQLRAMLLTFDIASSPVRFKKGNVRKDTTESIGVRFEIEKKSFNNFYKYIDFHHEVKRGKLVKALGL